MICIDKNYIEYITYYTKITQNKKIILKQVENPNLCFCSIASV
jgi:hypothetical protein